MSGVKGLLFVNVPPGKLPCSLHWLGNPCPDSSTNTWKLLALPRKAIPVGPFRPDLNTDTVKPFGTTMSCPLLGLKCTISVGQSGLVTSALTGEGYSGTTSTIATRKASAATKIAERIARTLMEEPPAVSDQGETWKGPGRARLAVYRACRRGSDIGGPRTGTVPISDLATPEGSRRVGATKLSLIATRTVRSRPWGKYDFVTRVACQEAGEHRWRPNVKAVTFAATETIGATVVFRSDELHGRLGDVTTAARGGAE